MGYTSRRKFLQQRGGRLGACRHRLLADGLRARSRCRDQRRRARGDGGDRQRLPRRIRFARPFRRGRAARPTRLCARLRPRRSGDRREGHARKPVPHRQRQQAGDVGDGVLAGRAGQAQTHGPGVRPHRHSGQRLRDAEGQAHPGDHHRASADPHLRRLAEQGPRPDVLEPADGSAPADRLDARERAARLIRPAPLMRIRTSATACSVASSRS